MIRNYLKVAWRNLLKNKGYTGINIGGLAVGMAVAMLIGLWINDELSYDKYHKNYDKIGQIMQHQTFNGVKGTEHSIPMPLVGELQKTYGSSFKYLVEASWQGDHILSFGDKKLTAEGNYMGADAPRLFSLKMLQGTADGLREPGSIILAQSMANALFGKSDPIGQLIKIDSKLSVKVTGVYENLPYSSQFRLLSFIAPFELYKSDQQWVRDAIKNNQWGNNSFQLYAQIADNTSYETVNARILKAKLNKVDSGEAQFKPEIFIHPMRDWHLRSHWENGVEAGGPIQYVWLFGIVGIFVLLLACINFMNLSTARSEKRAREVGIRKAIGSVRRQLIGQFLSESLMVSFIAFIFSIVIVQLSLPWFNQVADKKMHILWTSPLFWLLGIGFAFITGLIAGSYPALYLSSFQPVKVLKGTFKVGRFASLPRKILVVIQFTVSITLIIGTIVVYRQVQHVKDRPIGYDNKGIMMIQMKSPDYYGKYELLRTELKNTGVVQEISQSSSPLTGVWSNNGGWEWQGKDPNLQTDFATIWVTHDFGKSVGWTFVKGRDFSRDFPTDSVGLIINEAAVKFMNVKDPIGFKVRWDDKDWTIIGVIKDMLMESPYLPVKQTIYLMNYENVNWVNIKLNPEKSASESIAKVEAVFRKLIPSAPFDFKFADGEFATKFANEVRIGKLATFFALLAIFISCLGLFGLASFVAEQRTKEIGVRKVLGASVYNLWGMLSKDFVRLVIISCLIAVPLAAYFMHQWLQKYDYRTKMGWWIFVASTGGALIITLLTVSFQAIKAAVSNPVKSLRTE